MIRIVDIMREVAEQTSETYIKKYNPKSPPVKFFPDNYVVVGNELNKRGQSHAAMKEKYPAILLFTDNIVRRKAKPLKQWKLEVMFPIILIVADAVAGKSDIKRERVYYPVLETIERCFYDAIEQHPQIYTKDKFAPEPEASDKYDLVAILGKHKIFTDKLDGIEIKNLRLMFRDKNCLTLKK